MSPFLLKFLSKFKNFINKRPIESKGSSKDTNFIKFIRDNFEEYTDFIQESQEKRKILF